MNAGKTDDSKLIMARLSSESPWRVTYEVWCQFFIKERLTFEELRERVKNGTPLAFPFDKALQDESNAQSNLATLVK